MRRTLLMSIVLLILLLSGCWDSIPVEERAIVLAVGIDYLEDWPHYQVTLVYPLVEETRKQPSSVQTIRGESLSQAFASWHHASESLLSLAMTSVIVFGEDAARQSILSPIHDLYAFPDLRTASQVIVANGTARELLSVVPPESQRIALHLQRALNRGHFQRDVPRTSLADLALDVVTPGVDPLTAVFGPIGSLSTVKQTTGDTGLGSAGANQQGQGAASATSKGNDTPEDIQVLGAALWSLDKMVGMITHPELQMLLIARGEASGMQTLIRLKMEEVFTDSTNLVAVLIDRVTPKWRVSTFNNNPHFDLDVSIRLSLTAYQGTSDITDLENQRGLEELLAGAFAQSIRQVLELVCRHESDPLGLGQRYRVHFPKLWKPEEWRETLPWVTFDVRAKVELKNVGIHVNRLQPK